MKKLLLLLLISFSTYANDAIELPILDVYDGDTIDTFYQALPMPLNRISIRILHIDTPESPAASYRTTGKLGKAHCVKEAEKALQAKQAIIDLMGESRTMVITNYEWDKYGGRILANVSINGKDVATMLVEKGLAVKYEGEKKTTDWCI